MAVITIDDPADPRLTDYRDLTDVELRRRLEPAHGLFIAEGETVIRRALAAGFQPRSLLMERRWLDGLADVVAELDVPLLLADPDVLRSVTGYRVHRGALAAMDRRRLPPVEQITATASRLVVLEGLVDHTNVGAVFRSAAALGFDGVMVDPTCADPLYRRSVRVSMGTVFAIAWTRMEHWPRGLDDLRRAGFIVAALAPHPAAVPLQELAAQPPDRLALVLGTEGRGLSEAALSRVDVTVRIPMARGVDSLNVGAASAVACYALSPRPAPG